MYSHEFKEWLARKGLATTERELEQVLAESWQVELVSRMYCKLLRQEYVTLKFSDLSQDKLVTVELQRVA